ncbi:NACHT, LRR and PYD domains-containing protein 12 [Coregonus clupeaformis]|uniref:NACHT, LRR and PYD domains-containing protein 12 n=1 Tax=Coregonus clupeaformis TaxID=59861 RepID=UPI001BE0E799|nr:NACHT, LRR and PYD domains-containing protein 12 [Coregonus clupeaformis]
MNLSAEREEGDTFSKNIVSGEKEEQERSVSPVPSCVSMKSDMSMDPPFHFSKEPLSSEQGVHQQRPVSPVPSCVSMKSDRSMGPPINFSSEQGVHQERPASPVTSCVSMKSEMSMDPPYNFRKEPLSSEQGVHQERPVSPVPSCVSMKSDMSMDPPFHFSKEPLSSEQGVHQQRPVSPVPSCVSMKSDRSMGPPINFSSEQGVHQERPASPVTSCVSMKSEMSMDPPYNFRKEPLSSEQGVHQERPVSPVPSCVSMKSDMSMDPPFHFSKEPLSSEQGVHQQRPVSPVPSCVSMKSDRSMGPPINFSSEQGVHQERPASPVTSCVSMKSEMSMDPPYNFRKEPLSSEQGVHQERPVSPFPSCVSMKSDQPMDLPMRFSDEPLSNKRHQNVSAEAEIQEKLKSTLKKRFQCVFEGLAQHGNPTFLNDIYTEIFITEGGSGKVNNEHEIRQIETASRRPATQDTPIKCNDIFKPLPGQDRHIKAALTKGVAGIGKTVSVQKFILDWAEGKANKDIQFIFPLPFRELNLMRAKRCSLMELLDSFFMEIKESKMINYDECKVLFVFDGLDECRLPLDFQNNKTCSDVSESTSVDVLLTNLIKGNLLPSALLWTTSRPAAANQIPPECVDQVTELRGFNDPQKEEYFRKRFSDENLANRIISHMKSSMSLYIMCHIPVFCWVSATVLERMLGEAESGEIPKTLTQMCIHFLIFQTKQSSRKYLGEDYIDNHWNTEMIMKLGKLAYQQLEKGNLIFYEEDLRECDIDVTEASVYSGVCTQIFREEKGLCQKKVYCFVHLSIQEFLAALYVFLTFENSNVNLLSQGVNIKTMSGETPVLFLHKSAVDKALQSLNGHLDLFLRFLLGLSLKSNQTLLQGLLSQTGSKSHTSEETAKYIKIKIRKNPSLERCINLFHCLSELNDISLVEEIQSYLSSGSLSEAELSPAQWSTLVFVLLTSVEKQDVFELRKYLRSEEGLLMLLPVVKATRTAILKDCNLTERCCKSLASALSSNSSSLRELDLSDNKLQDSGVKLLSAGLKNPGCKLKTLRLKSCGTTKVGCAFLASALRSNSSHLRELDLSRNIFGDSGLKMLSTVLEDPHCKLDILSLSGCGVTEEGCASLASALRSNPSHLRELDLTSNQPGDSGVKLLSAVLENPQCKLQKLKLYNSKTTEEGCSYLASALMTNPSHLRELDLGGNKLRDSGMNHLSAALKEPLCKLETLRLLGCGVTEESCASLASALRSNPSHLRELDLTNNQPGDSGVKMLSAVLEDPLCKLERLSLKCCNLTEKCCGSLASALSSNSSSLRELHLSHNNLQDSGVKLLSAGLGNAHCKVETLGLSCCWVTEEGCAYLASALRSNPSHLRELDLLMNKPGDSGAKLLSDVLEDPLCKLEKLNV